LRDGPRDNGDVIDIPAAPLVPTIQDCPGCPATGSTAPARHDPVHSPAHYTWLSPEPRKVLLQWRLPWTITNVIKYSVRAGHKVEPGETRRDAALRDLRKARVNLDDEIGWWERQDA
jgi:hypothetical protein